MADDDTTPAPDATDEPIDERADAILEDDLARIVRKDMTVMSELLAKYRYYRTAATSPALTEELKDVEVVVLNVRDALEDLLGLLPGPPGRG
jgi:hypothetical protein